MDGLFDSAWIKWGGAVSHANALKASVNAYLAKFHSQGKGALRREYDAKHHCVIFYLDTDVPPVPFLLSLQLGDVLHNYRSCLDHLAWALVSRGRTPPSVLGKKVREVYFPIYSHRGHFNKALPLKLPGVSRPDIAKVRAAQPYRAPGGVRSRRFHYLSILNLLNNNDKHQRIEPIFAMPADTGGGVKVLAANDCTVTRLPRTATRYPLQPGAEVYRVYVKRTGPNPDVDMDISVTVLPAIYERVPLFLWLDNCEFWIFRLLMSFAEPPENLAEGLDPK